MRSKPGELAERDLAPALAEGWGIHVVAMRYAAVGAGSYHWVLRDRQGGRWFVTVDDLDRKAWPGQTRAAAFEGLRRAMDTALALRSRAGLRFVVAPVPALRGDTVRPLGSRHAIAVFPFLRGAAGRYGEVLSGSERGALADMLAALHRAAPATARAPVSTMGLPRRGALDTALRELGEPWPGGPFAERTRSLLAGAAGRVRHLLQTFDELADRMTAAGRELVITHGEPHPANVIRVGAGRMLIDWDTVGMALPERDLWMIAGGTGDGLRRYTKAAGRRADPAALALYRLRWALDDISIFVPDLRSEHDRTADAERAWLGLKTTLARVMG